MPRRASYPVAIPKSYQRQIVQDIVSGVLPAGDPADMVPVPRALVEAAVLQAVDIVTDGQLWDRDLTAPSRALVAPECGGEAWRSSLRASAQQFLAALEAGGIIVITESGADCALHNMAAAE